MTMQASLYASLGGFAALGALVGTRIYPDIAPMGVATPYVVWSEVGATPVNGLGGHQGLTQYRVQIVTLAGSALQARSVGEQVRAAMAAATDFKSIELDFASADFEEGSKAFGVRSDFSIWYRG